MIWRLPHPVRGLITALLVFVAGSLVGAMVDAFAMGLPELAVLALVSAGAGLFAATHTSSNGAPSS